MNNLIQKRVVKIHKLILRQNTGTPAEFAATLNISRSHLYNIIDDLKISGAEIKYSRKWQTFYYNNSFSLEIDTIKILT